MNRLTIRSADGRTNYQPGETAEFEAEWNLDQSPDAIELRLIWYTMGKGEPDRSVVETTRFESPGRAESRRWSVRLPYGPYSFSGKLVSLIWAVETVVVGSRETQSLDLTVGPGGEEVLLHR